MVIPVPVLRMTGRYVHIDWTGNDDRRGSDYDRMRVNDRRRRKALNVKAAVKTRLADTDGHTYIGGLCCRDRYQRDGNGKQHTFHARFLSLGESPGFVLPAVSPIRILTFG